MSEKYKNKIKQRRMKKNILAVLVAAFVIAMPSQAQVKFGVKAGLNLNSVSLKMKNTTLDANNRAGFFVGPTADITIPLAGLGVDVSLFYDNKSIGYSDIEGEHKKCLHYIDLPINLKYTFGLSSLASVYVATGPQFAWNVGDRSWKPSKLTNGWELKSSEFSWNFGVGATFISHVRVGYNFNLGIGETAELKPLKTVGETITGKLKNNTHQISVAYLF